ncbi:hypothetical protein KIH74_01125 [Kineosporia sp. J2-2]|uniref:Tetratricopeptide repeat protein n=1 Tax=Kineosporia corallincola TaxID=2835133 RepID=A0ABS5TAM8_9ACTN|nr:hypothetical protein [Kineosporia corallincola]MBT0767504.1 hypothetical protein [Kineosporia corallincola]
MSTASEEIREALADAESLPVGPERIGELDTLLSSVTRAGSASEVGRLGTLIRSALLTACLAGGRHDRVPELLGWLTARYDEAPGWLDEPLAHRVLANLAEAGPGLIPHPDVSRSLINHIVSGAEQRYAGSGDPAGPVLRARFLFTRHVHGAQSAGAGLDAWIEASAQAGPDPAGCPDCERAEQVRHLVELGAYQRAVDHAGPVLRAAWSECESQPAGMIGAVLPALLRTGEVGAAAAEHVRAVRLIRTRLAGAAAAAGIAGDSAVGDALAAQAVRGTGAADQLLACARTGRLRHGLGLLREWLPALAGAPEPLELLESAGAIARLTWSLAEAGHSGEVVLPATRAQRLPAALGGPEDLTVGLLGERVLAESARLAELFDQRNETTTVGGRLRETLGSGSLPNMPLEAFERRGLGEWAAPTGRGRRAGGDGVAPDSADITVLAKEFEDGLRTDSAAAMRAVLEGWRATRILADTAGDPEAERAAARLDGWSALDGIATHPVDPEDGPSPAAPILMEAAQAATLRLRAAGLPLEALLHDQACVLAAAQSRLMQPAPAMERIEELAAEVAGLGTGPDLGEALSRLVLAREIAAAAGVPVPDQISQLVPVPGALPEEATTLIPVATQPLVVDDAPDEDETGDEPDEDEVQPIHDPSVGDSFGPVAMPTSLIGPFLTTPIPVSPQESPGHRPWHGDDDPRQSRRRPDPLAELRAGLASEDVREVAQTLDLVNFDPLETAVAQLRSVPPERLEHRHLRALTRMLRLRARDEPHAAAVSTLTQAVATLPEGVRPAERAQAGADLAGLLAQNDPQAALSVWHHAVEDAEKSGEGPILGTLLAASAMHRHRAGQPHRAAADLARAVPLLDRYTPAALAGQCRVDLSRVLLELERPAAAAAAAEAALADVVDALREEGVNLDPPPTGGIRIAPDNIEPLAGEIAPEVASHMHLAGAAAFAAAEANSAAGAPGLARRLAIRSAQWHARNGNPIGQAEAWQLAARVAGRPERVAADLARAAELSEAGGDWGRAATCRRERVTAVRAAAGDEAALGALDEADTTLRAWTKTLTGRRIQPAERAMAEHQVRWHRVAVAEQRARLLALGGRFEEAMAVADGLVDDYTRLDDAWSARDLQGLRGQLRAELGDLEGAVADLRDAAEAAAVAGEEEQTHGLGARLAAVLGEAGRDDEAEAVWNRYCEPVG